MQKFEQLAEAFRQFIPFKIRYKNESKFMKGLFLLLKPFCPTFQTNFTTVIGSTIYFPSREFVQNAPHSAMRILSHEVVHLLDQQKFSKPVFMLSYLFPQLLALGVFSFPFIDWWSLWFLIFLLPLPAPFRFYFEARGYAMNVLTASESHKETVLLFSKQQFSSWNYYKMFPFQKTTEKSIRNWVKKAEKGQDKILCKVLFTFEKVLEG